MNRRLTAITVALVIASGLSTASAAIIVNDNFDSYANQAAFEAVWVPIGTVAPLGATLSPEQSVSPSQSVKIDANATDNSRRNRLTFAETGTLAVGDQLIWSFAFYDSPANAATANPQRNYANLQDTTAPAGTPQLVSMGLSNTLTAAVQDGNYYHARILGGLSNGGAASAYFKLNDPGAPLRSQGWHTLKAVLSNDGVGGAGATDFRFYVDNILSETVLNVGTIARSYDNIALGAGLGNSNTVAYFDDMYLEYVPRAFKVLEGATVIANNDSVSFGIVDQNDPNPLVQLTIQNTSAVALNLSNFMISTPFGIVGIAPTTVNANSSALLDLDMSTVAAGLFAGELTFDAAFVGVAGSQNFKVNLGGEVVAAIPEPSTLALAGLALVGLAVAARRRVR